MSDTDTLPETRTSTNPRQAGRRGFRRGAADNGVAEALDLLIKETKVAIAQNERRHAKGGAGAPEDLWILPIIGPPGSGKSRSLRDYMSSGAARRSVLHICVRSGTKTPMALHIQILQALAGDSASAGAAPSRTLAHVNRLVGELVRKKRTVVVALDEAHHLLAGNAAEMAATLNSFVKDGLFSVVLVGTAQMSALWRENREVCSRLKDPIALASS